MEKQKPAQGEDSSDRFTIGGVEAYHPFKLSTVRNIHSTVFLLRNIKSVKGRPGLLLRPSHTPAIGC